MPQRKNIIIGLTGPVGSGVSTYTKLFREDGFQYLVLSDPIKRELAKREKLPELHKINEIDDWRKKLQDIGNEGRKTSLSSWVENSLQGADSNKDIVLDGIRNVGEIEYLRLKFPNFFLIAIVATKDRRWIRVQDDYHKNLSLFERDDIRDSDEDLKYGQQVEKCVLEADYVVQNEEDYYPAAIRDQIIVDKDNLGLSLGYNENPLHMDSCKTGLGYCFKDANMEEKLEKMQGIHCPRCGKKQNPLAPWVCDKCNASLKVSLFPSRNMELCTAIHAEERAIRSLHGRSAEGSTLFVTTFPCMQCSRYIVDAKIKRVVYVEAYPIKESADFLKKNGVVIQPFEGFRARAFNLVFQRVG